MSSKQKYFHRWMILGLAFFGAWLFLVLRSIEVQLFPDPRLSQLRKRQFETVMKVEAKRGMILDRNGRELAISIPSFSLYADPSLIKRPKEVSRKLSKMIDLPWPAIYSRLSNSQKRFVWIKRFLEEDQKKSIEHLKIKGLGFKEELRRMYPNETLLSHTLGFVGTEGKGLEGIEAEYDAILRGIDQRVSLKRDARGRPLVDSGRIFFDKPDGADLHLTIDAELQYELERELYLTMEEQQAKGALGVILDAETSEVLAMASIPLYNPNSSRQFNLIRNRVVVDAFEPGSTLKPFVVAAALEKGKIQPNSKIYCENGLYRIGSQTVREADSKHHFGWLTISEILAFSSNIGAAKIGEKLGAEDLYDYLQRLNLGERTGIEFPGESRGILNPPPWRKHFLANVSFGHAVAISPIQMAAAYASLARGGIWRRPSLVRQVTSDEHQLSFRPPPDPGRRVMEAKVAKTLTLMLAGATGEGATGAAARVAGFAVAGKTGTAQKVNPNERGYLANAYISSFAGFFPAQSPRFVIYVAVDEPKVDYYGSQVAAPLFSRVARYALQKYGVPPVLVRKEDVVPTLPLATKPAFQDTSPGVVPSLQGLSLRESLRLLGQLGVEGKFHGEGFVFDSSPAAGEPLPKNKRVTLFLKNE